MNGRKLPFRLDWTRIQLQCESHQLSKAIQPGE